MELSRCSVVVEGESVLILSGDQYLDAEQAAREAGARLLLADAAVPVAAFEQPDSGIVLVDAAGAATLGPPRVEAYGEYRTDCRQRVGCGDGGERRSARRPCLLRATQTCHRCA